MKKKESTDLEVKVVDCSKFEEAYGSAEDGSTTLQKPFVLII